jgi:hypothetical protein
MDKIFKKSFRMEITIAAKDLEVAKELYELYGHTGGYSHVLNLEVVEDDYPWEEVIVDKYGSNVDIKYIEDENI